MRPKTSRSLVKRIGALPYTDVKVEHIAQQRIMMASWVSA
jgi:hypothetical protein